jgi:hypothetical protein
LEDISPDDLDPLPHSEPSDTAALRRVASVHEGSKWCSGCWARKDGMEFSRNAGEPSGLERICRVCTSATRREWYRLNREHRLALLRAWRQARKDEAARAEREFLASLPFVDHPLVRDK